jgi:hypothetical protein
MADSETFYRLSIDPAARERATLDSARVAEQAWVALFAKAQSGEGDTLQIPFEETRVVVNRTGITDYIHLNTWFLAYRWATLARDREALAILASFDLETLLHHGRFDSHMIALFKALRAFDTGDLNWPNYISEGMAHIGSPEVASREEAMYLQLDLFGLLASFGDQAEFTRQLETALKSYRAYWSATEERREDPESQAALMIAALAVKGQDQAGMAIEVESDYLPAGIVNDPHWFHNL